MKKDKIMEFIQQCENELESQFDRLQDISIFNQKKVLNAFSDNNVQARHLYGTTGYGYDDNGRDILCKLYSNIFKAESAIVSPNIVSGTHALTLMLFASLMPGDKLISISGKPYDTLNDVITGENKGSLKDYKIDFECIDLLENDDLSPTFDYEKIEKTLLNSDIKAVFLARSRGYSWRQALSIKDIENAISFVKKTSPNTLVLVDNCYGEFVEKCEPIEVGADLIAGSLIKNIGGGIAQTGGYVVGKTELVEKASYRLTSPSIGMEVGSYIAGYLSFYQGLFFAPSVTKNALKSALLFSKVYSKLGFDTLPQNELRPYDIVTSIRLNSAEQIIDFCGAIQEISPIDSNVKPVPWDMPGYENQVIMAAGTFVQGASIELSADAPIKEPYIVFVQGALTFEHSILAVEHTIESLHLL